MWSLLALTALGCMPPCWLHSRSVSRPCRCTKMLRAPNACSRSTTRTFALPSWKTKSRSTKCWKSGRNVPRSQTSTLTTHAVCAITRKRVWPVWTTCWQLERPSRKRTPPFLLMRWRRSRPVMWPPCSSPLAQPETPKAWSTHTAVC